MVVNRHKSYRAIKKILIANRSEVVLRIQYTCHALGIQTVVIYSFEDAKSGYVRATDEAYLLPGSGARAYLDAEAVLTIAKKAAVDAIHPGYGFFSENADFARKVVDAGLIWVGPDSACLASMGDKIVARSIMETAGVPVVPGVFIDLRGAENGVAAQRVAEKIGFPVVIKDPRGGGGRGMKKVDAPQDFLTAWRVLVGEAARMTGSCRLLIEKYVVGGRHVEVQIAGDGENNIHFFERECSIQRRHQKVIEETPCLFVERSTLTRMYEAAVLAARAVGYQNIGTVEFMVTPDQNFYFLEMNTRLQVEHSVTELTTNVDLVALQLRLAQGEPLPFKQQDVVQHGHALECRIYAEDPAQNFVPTTGVVTDLTIPAGPFLRCDHDLTAGCEITPFFDPMIAKVTTFAQNRQLATAYMQEALRQFSIGGISTNIQFLQAILAGQAFSTGRFDTQWLADRQVTAGLLASILSQKNNEAINPDIVALVAAGFLNQIGRDNMMVIAGHQLAAGQGTNWWKARSWK